MIIFTRVKCECLQCLEAIVVGRLGALKTFGEVIGGSLVVEFQDQILYTVCGLEGSLTAAPLFNKVDQEASLDVQVDIEKHVMLKMFAKLH